MKKRIVALLLAVIMVLTVLPTAFAVSIDDFRDVSGHWGYTYIKWGVDNKLFNGMSETEFRPDAGMTRAMFVTVLGRLAESYNKKTTGYTSEKFSDVQPDTWYTQYVAWADANKLVEGYTDGTFGVDRLITREEMCVVMMRFLQYMGQDVDRKDKGNTFADAADVSEWATKAVNVCIGYELIIGMGNNMLKPKDTATRAQVAALLSRLDITVQGGGSSGGGSGTTHTDLLAKQVASSTEAVETAVWNVINGAVAKVGQQLPAGVTEDDVKATYSNYTIQVEVSAELASYLTGLVDVGTDVMFGLTQDDWMQLFSEEMAGLVTEAKAYGDLATAATLSKDGTALISGKYSDYAAIYNMDASKTERAKELLKQLRKDCQISENDAVNMTLDTMETVMASLAGKQDATVTLALNFDATQSYYHEDYTIVVKTVNASTLSDKVAGVADKAAKLLANTTYTDKVFTTDVSEVSYWKQLKLTLSGVKETVQDEIDAALMQAEEEAGGPLTDEEKQQVQDEALEELFGQPVTLWSNEFWALAMEKFAGAQYDFGTIIAYVEKVVAQQSVAGLLDKATVTVNGQVVTGADVTALKTALDAAATDTDKMVAVLDWMAAEIGVDINTVDSLTILPVTVTVTAGSVTQTITWNVVLGK